jgi:hypothetical protein
MQKCIGLFVSCSQDLAASTRPSAGGEAFRAGQQKRDGLGLAGFGLGLPDRLLGGCHHFAPINFTCANDCRCLQPVLLRSAP